MSTTRSCYLQLENKWGSTIKNAVLTRQSSPETDSINEPELANDTKSYEIQINFETGAAPAYDYWNVSFTDSNGDVWSTPNNDRCNISKTDEGKVVLCTIDNNSDGKYLHIGVEDGCDFEITKND